MSFNILLVIICIFFYIVFYIFLEYLKRKLNISSSVTRRIAHIVSGFGAMVLYYLLNYYEFIFILLFFSIFFVISMRKQIFTSIHTQERITVGEIVYPLGILGAQIISSYSAFQFESSVLVLSIADPLASYVGNKKGVGKKTNIGSWVFFVSSLLVLLIIYSWNFQIFPTGIVFIKLIIVALLTTTIERISIYGLDNLAIPIMVSLLLKFLF